jgi:hypothetical protein
MNILKNFVNKILKKFHLTLFILTKIFRNLNLSARALNSDFPIQKKGIIGYYKSFYKGNQGNFFLRFYNSNQNNLFFLSTFYNLVRNHIFAYEIFESKKFYREYFKKFTDKDLKVIGISHFENKKLNFKISTKSNSYNFLVNPERLSYLKFKDEEVKISSDSDFLVSENFNKIIDHKPFLVLAIFIDGFNYIQNCEYLKKIAPNTYKFFNQKGHMFANHFSNAEWTVPSFANIFTGKYTHNHGLFHPNANHDVGKKNKLISEYFQENGYLTFMCNSGWRSSPGYGYIKGFDRTIYKKEANSKFIIGETLEHLNAFSKTKNFCFLGFNDLHHFIDVVPPLSSQVQCDIKKIHDTQTDSNNFKSVEQDYDEKLIEKLKAQTLDLDSKLKQLYDFVENSYPENYIVTIFTDHGHAYLSKDPHILSHYRTSIPWLIKASKNIDYSMFENLFTSNIDILPSLLELSNIPLENASIDGKSIFKKSKYDKFIIESIYPNKKAYFKFLIDNKFSNLDADIEVDNFGSINIINQNNHIINIEEIINHWNKNFLLTKKDF